MLTAAIIISGMTISMALNGKYLAAVPFWASIAVALFVRWYSNRPVSYGRHKED